MPIMCMRLLRSHTAAAGRDCLIRSLMSYAMTRGTRHRSRETCWRSWQSSPRSCISGGCFLARVAAILLRNDTGGASRLVCWGPLVWDSTRLPIGGSTWVHLSHVWLLIRPGVRVPDDRRRISRG
jgi:hypothetical protein